MELIPAESQPAQVTRNLHTTPQSLQTSPRPNLTWRSRVLIHDVKVYMTTRAMMCVEKEQRLSKRSKEIPFA